MISLRLLKDFSRFRGNDEQKQVFWSQREIVSWL
jgi:hypothetical protein